MEIGGASLDPEVREGLSRSWKPLMFVGVAAIVLLYVVLFVSRLEVRLPEAVTRWTSPPVGLAAGVLQGATGMSGPLVQTYLHAYRLDKEAFVASTVTLYGLFAIVQAISIAGLDLYTTERMIQGVATLLPMAVMLPVGARLARRMPQRVFDYCILALLLASTAKLLFDAVTGG